MEVSGQIHALHCLTPGKLPRYLLNRRLGGFQNRPEGTGEHKKSLVIHGVRTLKRQNRSLLTIQTEPSRFLLLLCMTFKYRPDKNNRRKAAAILWKNRTFCFHAIKEVRDQFNISSSSSIIKFGDLRLYCKCRYFTDSKLLCVRVMSVFFPQKEMFSIIFVPLTWRIYVLFLFRFQGIYLFSCLRILRCGHSSSDPCHITYDLYEVITLIYCCTLPQQFRCWTCNLTC